MNPTWPGPPARSATCGHPPPREPGVHPASAAQGGQDGLWRRQWTDACPGDVTPGSWPLRASRLRTRGRHLQPPPPHRPPRPPTLRNLYRRKVNQLVSIFSATDSVLEQSTWGDLGPTRPPLPQGQWSGLASEHVSPSDKDPRQGIPQVGPQSRLSSAWAGPVDALPQGWAGRGVGEPGCGWAQECPGHSGQTGCRWAGVHRHGAEGRRQGGGVGGQEHREVGATGGQWAGTQRCRWVGPQGGGGGGGWGTQGGGGRGAGGGGAGTHRRSSSLGWFLLSRFFSMRSDNSCLSTPVAYSISPCRAVMISEATLPRSRMEKLRWASSVRMKVSRKCFLVSSWPNSVSDFSTLACTWGTAGLLRSKKHQPLLAEGPCRPGRPVTHHPGGTPSPKSSQNGYGLAAT